MELSSFIKAFPGVDMKLNCGSGDHELEGFVNLDKDNGWLFQMGFKYKDNSIEAITESHSLMFLTEKEIEQWVEESYRVLKVGGILRITEDYSSFEGSKVYGGWHGKWLVRTLFGPEFFIELLSKVGFEVFFNNYYDKETQFKDNSLMQLYHGCWPRVFHIEGKK